MPAPKWLLAAFTAVAAGSVSRSCVDGWLSGISFWHVVNGTEWKGSNQLRIAKTAVLKMVPDSSKTEKRLSVVSAQADVFAKKLSKIGKILRIFDKLDEIKSRWVLCQS
jgi:hypothetical protein